MRKERTKQTDRFLTKTPQRVISVAFYNFCLINTHLGFDICCVVFVAVWRSKEEWPNLTSTPPTRSRSWRACWSLSPPASAQSEATVLCPGARNERKPNQLHHDAKIRWDQTGSLNRRPFPVCYCSSTSYCTYRKPRRGLCLSFTCVRERLNGKDSENGSHESVSVCMY